MSRQPLSILVVDDDADTCENLADILTEMDYDVDVAHNGRTALEMVRRKPYDVALLDLKMPDIDGLTLYREIRRLRAATVAMIVTAYATTETTEEALQAGAWQVLPKPVDFGRLLPLVDEAARQPLVMVVDDDHELCENLWDLLREKKYRLSIAHDDRQAKEKLRSRHHDVVLIDMKLPHGDGRKVLKQVRDANPEARAVLITGHRDEMAQAVEQALREGADAVCYKPFDVPALLEVIGRLTM